jgi:hypothetical protein
VSALASTVVVVSASSILVLCAAAACGERRSVAVDSRIEAALARGRARVLVELRAGRAAPAEGASPDKPAGRERQIAAAQDAVLARLAGTDATLVRRFASTPWLALEIGPTALAALRTMPDLVVRVVADAVIPPADAKPR